MPVPALPTTAPANRVVIYDGEPTVKEQRPSAFLDYWMCLGDVLGDDTIDAIVIDSPVAITIDSEATNTVALIDSSGRTHAIGTVIMFWLSGCVDGEHYEVTASYTTAAERQDERTLTIYCNAA